MARELEAKIKVVSCEPVRAKLQTLGAGRIYKVLEQNSIFDTPDQQLFKRGCGLRVRTCAGEGDVPPATLTYKGPQEASTLKSRDEIETHVSDSQATMAILHALGFQPVIAFEKRREEWQLDGLSIELDEVPRLGCFVEIEGPDENTVARMQDKLGLAGEPSIQDSYIALLINHARENGLPFECIRFS